MAPFATHCQDTARFLGKEFQAVHRWMDACFAELGPKHRRARHHHEGVQEAVGIFGEDARLAAQIHILRDCRHIPTLRDYELGLVDPLGLKKSWSTAAYIRYGDREFEDLVKEHLKPTALLLWAFLAWDDAVQLLSQATLLDHEDILALKPSWERAQAFLLASNEQESEIDPFEDGAGTDTVSAAYLQERMEAHIALNPSSDVTFKVGYLPLAALAQPFVFIDDELLEDLKPELSGSSPEQVAEFALPRRIQAPMTALADPSNQKTVMIMARQKSVTVSNVKLRQTDEGTEVSYIVSPAPSGIVAAKYGNQYVLRNGIHRAYLLSQLGVTHIPCMMVVEKNFVPLFQSSYPTFSPPIFVQPRRPMMTDFLKPELCLRVPLRRTKRLIRISAEESNLPID